MAIYYKNGGAWVRGRQPPIDIATYEFWTAEWKSHNHGGPAPYEASLTRDGFTWYGADLHHPNQNNWARVWKWRVPEYLVNESSQWRIHGTVNTHNSMVDDYDAACKFVIVDGAGWTPNRSEHGVRTGVPMGNFDDYISVDSGYLRFREIQLEVRGTSNASEQLWTSFTGVHVEVRGVGKVPLWYRDGNTWREPSMAWVKVNGKWTPSTGRYRSGEWSDDRMPA